MSLESANKDERKPRRIGKYEVLRHIATGGMGSVFKARDTELNRVVALKVMSPKLASNPSMMERFRREARSAANLRHENIVTLYDFGEQAGVHYLVLEYVDGIDLHDHITKKGKLEPEEARLIMIQAARALEHANKQGIVHRDIKPSNFLITRNAEEGMLVKLTDMGLARKEHDEEFRVTRAGTTVGTVDYMAPEQARDSAAADIRSDIYSLGCTLFHMLAGHCPFPQGSLTERIYHHVETPPPEIRTLNPKVPLELAAILQRMLAKRPEDRYQNPRELLHDLEHPEKMRVRLDDTARLAALEELAGDSPGETLEDSSEQDIQERPDRSGVENPLATLEELEKQAETIPKRKKVEKKGTSAEAKPAPPPKRPSLWKKLKVRMEKLGPFLDDLPPWWPWVAAGLVTLVIMILLAIFWPRTSPMDRINRHGPIQDYRQAKGPCHGQ